MQTDRALFLANRRPKQPNPARNLNSRGDPRHLNHARKKKKRTHRNNETKRNEKKTGPKNLRFPRVTHIRKDKGPEGCIDTNELAALQARPRIAEASRGHRNNRTPGGHGGAGSRRNGGGDAGERKRARGGRQVSELYAMAEGDVAVKEEIFVAASDRKKPLEMCIIGDRFNGVSTTGKRQPWRGGRGRFWCDIMRVGVVERATFWRLYF